MYVKDYIIKKLSNDTTPFIEDLSETLLNSVMYTGNDLLYCRETIWINNVHSKSIHKLSDKDYKDIIAMDIPVMKPQIEVTVNKYISDLKLKHLLEKYYKNIRRVYLNIVIIAPTTFFLVYFINTQNKLYFLIGSIALLLTIYYIKAWSQIFKIQKEIKKLENK